jgi:adenylate kinase
VARSDDSETVVRERLKIYWRDTRPMIEYYSSRPTFRRIDGLQTPEQVREALVSAAASALGLPASQLRSLVAKKLGAQA